MDENAVLDHLIAKLLKYTGLYGERNATRGVNNRLHSCIDSNDSMIDRERISERM